MLWWGLVPCLESTGSAEHEVPALAPAAPAAALGTSQGVQVLTWIHFPFGFQTDAFKSCFADEVKRAEQVGRGCIGSQESRGVLT